MTDDDDIKKKKASRTQTSMLVWVLMAMLITGLGGFGVTNFGRSVTAIGSVGTQEIEANTYARALRNQINALSRQFGQQLTLQEAKIFGLDAQVLSGLIANAALDNEAQRIGLSVGDLTVANRVAAEEVFKDVTGAFNADTYRLTLEQAGMVPKEYEAGIRADVARTVLQTAVISGTRAPDALTDRLLAFAGEKRGFTVLQMTEATLPEPLAPATDADLKTYYDANIDTFTRPEAKRLTFVTLLPETLAAAQTVDPAAVQALYDERLSLYVVPEKRLVERLVYATDADAAAAKARLDAGDGGCQKRHGVFQLTARHVGALFTICRSAPSARENINPRIALNGFCVAGLAHTGFAVLLTAQRPERTGVTIVQARLKFPFNGPLASIAVLALHAPIQCI